MSITDELREYVKKQISWLDASKVHYRKLFAIADRIDAEHEAQLNDAFETRNSDENLEADGWIRLPVDADGEPIRFGDKVEWRRTCSEDYSVTEHGTVDGVEIYQVNGEIITHVSINRNGYNNHMPPSALRHRHEPTVKEMLFEYHERMEELGTTDDCVGIDRAEAVRCLLRDRDELTAEYAARLQLRGDSE